LEFKIKNVKGLERLVAYNRPFQTLLNISRNVRSTAPIFV
jgi:hypothetical protein